MQVTYIFFFRGRACSRWGEATVHHIEAETPEYIFLGWTRHQMEWKKSFASKWSEAARISLASAMTCPEPLARRVRRSQAPKVPAVEG